jgi:hypothetical protein
MLPPIWLLVATMAVALAGMATFAGTSAEEINFGQVEAAAYQYLAPLLAIPALMMLAIRVYWGGKFARVALLIFLVVTVTFFFFYGKRLFLILPVTALVIYFYLARGRRPNWSSIAIIVIFGLLPIFTILEVARQHPDRSALEAVTSADIRPGAATQRFSEGDTTAMFPALALQMMTEDSRWTQHPGQLVLSVATRLIPHSLWSDKPVSSTSALYSRFFPANYRVQKAGTAFTLVSDFYYDSGVLGVVIGMAIAGWTFARFWFWFNYRRLDPWAWALYGPAFAMSTLLFRGDLALSFGVGIFVFGPTLIGVWVASRRMRLVTLAQARGLHPAG